MGSDPRNDSSPGASGLPRRSRRGYLLIAVLGSGLLLILAVLFRERILGVWRGGAAGENPFPPGALDDYIPEDSEVVAAVDLRALRESPLGQGKLAPMLKQLVRQGEQSLPWIGLLGVNAFDEVDYLRISFAPGSGGQPLWFARGRFDPARFQVGPDRLERTTLGPYRVWEYRDRETKRSTFLAPVGDALIAGETPARVRAALDRASHPRPLTIRDAALRESLDKVDRRETLWLAASFAHLGHLGEFDRFEMKMLLSPLLKYADRVYGGLTCAEDVRAELHFHSTTPENADKLEADLKHIPDLAAGAALFLGRRKELLPLFRLLATAQTSREGQSLTLRCRANAADW